MKKLIAFAADSVWSCIRNMWNTRNTTVNGQIRPLWIAYGFTDAFNPELYPWFDMDVIGFSATMYPRSLEGSIVTYRLRFP